MTKITKVLQIRKIKIIFAERQTRPIAMPLFRVTVKQMKLTSGIRIEPGMSVDVVSNSMSNPLTTNGGQIVADAFMRVYGIDLKRIGALSTVYLDVVRVG